MNPESPIPATTTPAALDEAALLAQAQTVISGNPSWGTVESPTQLGFFMLAKQGRNIWNAWRKAYPEPVANFVGTALEGLPIDFSGFSFVGGGVSLDKTYITPCVDFNNCNFGRTSKFAGAKFGNFAMFSGAIFKNTAEFVSAEFQGDVLFQDCLFQSGADFERAIFYGVPNFHGCTLHQNTSFDKAQFLAPPSAHAARAYRTLKLAFAQQHAFHEEQRFFKLEMKAEAGIAEYPKKLMYQLYETLSDYGSSLLRPVLFWILCLLIFAFSYGLLTGATFSLNNIDTQVTVQWIKFSVLNAVPLPGLADTLGLLRKELFPDATTEMKVIILEILHKTFSLLAFFLIGLALRNLFKMKG